MYKTTGTVCSRYLVLWVVLWVALIAASAVGVLFVGWSAAALLGVGVLHEMLSRRSYAQGGADCHRCARFDFDALSGTHPSKHGPIDVKRIVRKRGVAFCVIEGDRLWNDRSRNE